jgi:hypothetical protein
MPDKPLKYGRQPQRRLAIEEGVIPKLNKATLAKEEKGAKPTTSTPTPQLPKGGSSTSKPRDQRGK